MKAFTHFLTLKFYKMELSRFETALIIKNQIDRLNDHLGQIAGNTWYVDFRDGGGVRV